MIIPTIIADFLLFLENTRKKQSNNIQIIGELE